MKLHRKALSLPRNQVRIIAGKWRTRKITFLAAPELRPTPDRVRETLFNWLTPHLLEANCLDLFAGSGVLGFEALSRGAKFCVFLERNPLMIKSLQKNAEMLKAGSLKIVKRDALVWLKENALLTSPPFDIVFLDPPYQQPFLLPCFSLLTTGGWLKPKALIYFESPKLLDPHHLPSSWKLLQAKKAGKVYYCLAQNA